LFAIATSIAPAQEPRVQDPMRPPVLVAATGIAPQAVESLRLTGVLVSESRRIAVINGKFYRVGDRVNGDQIIRIEPGSIQLRRGNEQVRISVQSATARAVDKDGDQDK
jgi:MSHA biogenesis protein MshK